MRVNATTINLADYSSKESLRTFILAERGREFYSEGLRREGLIRKGSFTQNAIDRGKAAKPFQVLYPIPQNQIENNPNLKENEEY